MGGRVSIPGGLLSACSTKPQRPALECEGVCRTLRNRHLYGRSDASAVDLYPQDVSFRPRPIRTPEMTVTVQIEDRFSKCTAGGSEAVLKDAVL